MSKALNELKKATLASYLSKAGSRVRSGTSLGKSFDRDAGVPLKKILKHSPNVWDPKDPEGRDKDPEQLKKAEADYKANMDLSATFHRQARNTIKGIALAGKKLAKEEVVNELSKKTLGNYIKKSAENLDAVSWTAGGTKRGPKALKLLDKVYKRQNGIHRAVDKLTKEEVINERNTESHPELWNTHELRHESGKVLKKGDVVKDFRGDKHKIKGFEMPHHSGSTGRVYTNQGSFFPGVVDAKIVRKKAVKEEAEQIDELKTSTLASVATKRYQQAQQALKDKDYGGYVKAKAKSMKAADATVPKSGWSPEDDKKNEEVVPVVSAQEKYRQIKESKLRARKGK
jgi:hypothetical protein